MSLYVDDFDIGLVTAYAYYVEGGGTLTEEEFTEFIADFGEAAQTAVNAAGSAQESAETASTAAGTATTKAGEASTSATGASSSASAASASASQASGSATNAAASATAASGSATAAAGSASTATTKASEASASATAAQTAQTAAEAAQSAAETARGKAEDAQEAAETTAQSISASAAQIATNAADIAELQSEVSQKANINGYYEELSAGTADQLNSTQYVEDSVPYLFRTTGGSADVGDRADVRAIVGGTVAWNQLIQNGDFSNGAVNWSVTDGTLTASGGEGVLTGTSSSTPQIFSTLNLLKNHIYFGGISMFSDTELSAVAFNAINNGSYLLRWEDLTTNAWNRREGVCKCLRDASYMNIYSGHSGDNNGKVTKFKNIVFIDLTAMFGTTIADYIYSLEQATAGAGVAFFRKLFPKDYYPYDAGTLKSVEGVSSHDMVGFNQWDEEWEVGGIDNTTGQNTTASDRIRSKNYIPVLPSTTYYFKSTNTLGLRLYDADKTFVDSTSQTNLTYVIPANVRFVRFICLNTSTYNHDICINLSDPVKNGTYEPYVKHSYPLDSTLILRGIPKLAGGKLSYDGDRYLPDGTVERRYALVDLGTLNWIDTSTANLFKAEDLTGHKLTEGINILCDGYTPVAARVPGGNITNNTVKTNPSQATWIYVKDENYSTPSAMKTALSGVYLVYELATQTMETANSYQSLQVCDPNGTEEFVTTGIVPVGHETRYPENLRAKIEGLPWDFSSLIAPTEKTTKASRNYTTGSMLIMNNVLYKVTANIANGGTITPNTNVTATTLSEVISALQ